MIAFTKSFDELKDIFLAHLHTQKQIENYPNSFLSTRANFIQWIIEICEKLHFQNETLHRTIYLFDVFTTKNENQRDLEDYNTMKLTVIACLSIATKLNEQSNNCVKYFTDNILNRNKKKQAFIVQDLIKREAYILNTVNYETNYSNVYHFNTIFTHVILDQLHSSKDKVKYQKMNKKILQRFVLSDYCVTMSPINSAIIVFNKTLKHIDATNINIQQIIKSIETLASKQVYSANLHSK